MGSDADAQDALQDALIALARGIRRFDGRAAFGTWAYRVATNACLDELRRRRRRPVPDALGAPSGDGRHEHGAALADVADPGGAAGGPGGAIVGGAAAGPAGGGVGAVAERLVIDAALARLPADFRAAVVLRDLCDLDYGEIGRVLDIPPGTVRSRISRGRAQLADLLGNRDATAERPTTTP